ncbi:MAG: helix-turn-helix domain-containing protein [Iphinoe sp. HA4291-MV1]|jgi:transposase|nr:helix-turn-helix domain-containing protein [Iphinoe sp. HA4291-MV1]
MQSKALENNEHKLLHTEVNAKQDLYLTPFQRKLLLKNLETDLRSEYRRRIEIMLLADAGQSQTQICEALGCSQETARYWIGMAKSGEAHHWCDRPMGRPKLVNEQYLERLKELASHSPREYGYPFQRWTAQWLSKHLAKEFGIKVSNFHITRLLKSMGLSTRHRGDAAPTAAEQMSTENSGITIHDLQSELSPDFLWHFNLIQLSHQEVNQQ